MKRFWLVLLSLGLIVAFSTSAMAVDVKFSGSFYAAGLYQDKTSLQKDATTNMSTAFYYQRLRVKTEFVVSPGLSLVTRFDAMERIWGGARSSPNNSGDMFSSGTRAENENIAFDLAYIQYASPIGLFLVGYMDDGAWGTVFNDNTSPLGKIQWISQFGPVTTIAYIGKFQDNSASFVTTSTSTDRDIDQFVAAAIYSFKGGSAGLLGKYLRAAVGRNSGAASFYSNMYFLVPYAIVQIGPVKIQTEVLYGFGDYQKFENGVAPNSSLDNWAGWIDAVADFGMVYVGGTVAYVAGDDKGTTTKKEGGVINGGADWNPCLILFNFDRYYWAGQITGNAGTATPNTQDSYLSTNASGMTNAWFGQGKVGVKPVPALDIMGSVAVAYADKKPTSVLHNDYGWEVDVTATYKITNNLSYMLGVGYLFTGGYFKGTSDANVTNDDFLVINKLTLTF